MCVAVVQDGYVGRIDALLFLAAYVAFTAYLVRLVRHMILGLSGLVTPLPVQPALVASDCWWMLATMLTLVTDYAERLQGCSLGRFSPFGHICRLYLAAIVSFAVVVKIDL